MNSYQILNKDGKPIAINVLDAEVCALLNVDVQVKHYCRLGKREDYPEGRKGDFQYFSRTSNWHDTLGWLIAAENKSLEDIIEYYTNILKEWIGKEDESGGIISVDLIYPYHMKVLRSWIAKGYTTKQIVN